MTPSQEKARLTPQRPRLAKLRLWSPAIASELRKTFSRSVKRSWVGQWVFELTKFRCMAFDFYRFLPVSSSKKAIGKSKSVARTSPRSLQSCRLITRSMTVCSLELQEASEVVAAKTENRHYSHPSLARFLKRRR